MRDHEIDPEKADLFRLTAAVRGYIGARHECGTVSYDRGNHELGIQHWKVAAEAGMQPSLDALKHIYNNDRPGKEFVGKEEMASIYRACHQAQKEVWSEQKESRGRYKGIFFSLNSHSLLCYEFNYTLQFGQHWPHRSKLFLVSYRSRMVDLRGHGPVRVAVVVSEGNHHTR